MAILGDMPNMPDTRLTDLQARLRPLVQQAEANARSGVIEYDERARWRRFAQQLAEAVRG